MYDLPETGFLRLAQIIGRTAVSEEQAARNRSAGRPMRRARSGTPPIIPVSATTWWTGVRRGRYPKPIKLGSTTVWRVEDIRALVHQIAREQVRT